MAPNGMPMMSKRAPALSASKCSSRESFFQTPQNKTIECDERDLHRLFGNDHPDESHA